MGIYFEDGDNVRTNSVTITGCGGPAYNAVLSAVFSAEGTTEPVTLQEAKDWCRIDGTDDDTLITALIKAARIACELYANVSIISRTVTVKIKNSLGDFVPPYGPLKTVTSATDSDGNTIADFDFDKSYDGKITVIYTAGYTILPENLKTAVKNQIAWMYQNRGGEGLKSMMAEEAKLILNQVRNG